MPVTGTDWTLQLRRTPIGKAVPADSAPATAWKACSAILAPALADVSAKLQQVHSELPAEWRDPQLCFLPKPHKPPSEPFVMSCRIEATWFRDEFWRVVCAAVPAIVVMTIAHKIATALAKCTDEGEWWKSIKVQRENTEEMQTDASAIIAGSLIVQRSCYYLSLEANIYHRFMPILHGEPGDHVDHCVSVLIGIEVLLLLASAGWAVWPRPTRNEKPCVGSFLNEYFGALGAVTVCWCFQAGHDVIPAWYWYTVLIATKKESDSVLHSGRRAHCHDAFREYGSCV